MVVQAAKALAAAENEEAADAAKIAAAMVVHADAALEAADYTERYTRRAKYYTAERYMRRAKAAVEVAEADKALAAAVTEEEVADAKRYQRAAATQYQPSLFR